MPAQTVEEVKRILHMEVKYEDAINKLGEYRHVIEDITKQMKDLKKQMQSGNRSSSEIKSMNAQYAALDTTLRVVKKDSQELTKTVQNEIKVEREQDNSLRSLRAQLSNLTKAYDSLSAAERNAARGTELQKKINDVTTRLKAAEMSTQRFYRNVGNYQDALNGLNQIKAGFSALSGVIGGLLGGLGLQQLTNNIISVSREFEDAISRVRAVSNATMQDFLTLRDKALELGATTRYTSGEVAQGMEELARKGFSAKQTLDSIRPTLELAQANMVSIADAAQVSSSAVRAFGLETEDLSHTNDILSSVCANSASNLSLLGEAMKTAGPVAKTANVSLEETSALIGSLANVGMTGSDAGTGIKQIILALSSAATTKKGAKVLEHYNIQLDETRIKEEGLLSVLKEMKEKGLGESLTDLQKLTGKYASPRIANLINNIDQAIALNEKLKNSLGENERMFEQSLSPLSNSIYQMQSAWQNFMTNMENSSDSVFTKVLDSITEIIRFVNKFPGLVMGVFGAILASVTLTPLIKSITAAYNKGVAAAKAAALERTMIEEESLKKLKADYEKVAAEEQQIKEKQTQKEVELAKARATEEEIQAEKSIAIEKARIQSVLSLRNVEFEQKLALLQATSQAEEKLSQATIARDKAIQQNAARMPSLLAKRRELQGFTTAVEASNSSRAQKQLAILAKETEKVEKEISRIKANEVKIRERYEREYGNKVVAIEQEVATRKAQIEQEFVQKKKVIDDTYQASINPALQNERRAAQERIRLEEEVQQAKTEAAEIGESKRRNIEKQTLHQQKLNNYQRVQTISLMDGMQYGIKGIGRAIGSVVSMLKFQIWISGITAITEAVGRLISLNNYVKKDLAELDEKIMKINAGETDTIKNIENIKRRINDILNTQNRTEGQQKELNRLLNVAARLTNAKEISEGNVLKLLDLQIKRIKEQNRLRAIRDSIGEDSKKALDITTSYNGSPRTINEPEDIRRIITDLAEGTAAQWYVALALENFEPQWADSKVLGTKTLKNGKKVTYRGASRKQTEKNVKAIKDAMRAITGFGRGGDLLEELKDEWSYTFGDIAELEQILISAVYKFVKIKKNDFYDIDEDLPQTENGDYNSVDWGNNKGKNGREFDPLAYLQNLLKKYTTEFNSIVAETTLDVIDKQRKEIDNVLISLKGDVYKIIGGEVDDKKYDPVPQWKRAAAKYPKLAAQVTEMMNKAIEQATVRAQMKIDQLNYQANERTLKIEKTGWDARIALAKAKLQEYFLVTTQNAQQVAGRTLEQQEEEYLSNERAAAVTFNLEKQNKEKELVTSGLVKGSDGKELKTREQVLKAYEAYAKRREEIEEELSQDLDYDREYELRSELSDLNSQNEALARYYDEKSLMEARYEQERLNSKKAFDKQQLETTKKFYNEETRLILQGMQNELVALQNGCDEQTNANRSYHSKNKIGEQQYWDDIEWMLGERQTKEFQMQYEAAKKEYDRIVEFGKLEIETEEDFNARKLAAEKKMIDVETKVNDQIYANHVAVIQSTQSMVGSFGDLASAMIDDEKEKAEAMKAFTLMQAMLQLALSMANIVEKASHKGAFGIPEAIAGIAEVTAVFATIISTIKSTDAEGYATGGKVTGPGTGTSDSIPANLSNGEFVMTAKATKLFEPLLVAMNGIGAGVAIPRNNYVQTQQSADLTDAFARAAQEITPVVDVREVTRVQNRVKTIQNIGSYKL